MGRLQLMTKAYDMFKAYKASRTSLSLAKQIATTHQEVGNFDMALKCVSSFGSKVSL